MNKPQQKLKGKLSAVHEKLIILGLHKYFKR